MFNVDIPPKLVLDVLDDRELESSKVLLCIFLFRFRSCVPLLTSPFPGLSERFFAFDSPDRIDRLAKDCFGLAEDIELGGVD